MKRKIFSKLLMGAFLIASVSMFVSCKDYDDDIQKNAADIAALKAQLGTDINAAKEALTTQLNSAKTDLDQTLRALIDKKADASALDAYAKKEIEADVQKALALESRIAVLESQLGTLATAEALTSGLAGKADAAEFEKVKGMVMAINGAYIDEAKATEIAQGIVNTLDIQGTALKVFQENMPDLSKYLVADELGEKGKAAGFLTSADLEGLNTKVQNLIDLLNGLDDATVAALKELATKDLLTMAEVDAEIEAKLTEKLGELNDAISTVNADLSAIEMFVKKRVTSVVLKPSFYWEGIEAIEVPYLKTPEFVENGKYDFTYTVLDNTQGDRVIDVHVDNVMAWLATDGTKLGSETEKTWNAYIDEQKPTNTASGALTAYSLIELDGVKMADNQKKKLQYVSLPNDTTAAVAEYHINPYTADLKNAKYSFFQNTAEVFTRADASIGATPIDSLVTFNKNGGILTVPFKVNYDEVMKYFSKWAFNNDTYAYSQDGADYAAGYEPLWDDAHYSNYLWVNYSTGTALAEDGTIEVITDIDTDSWNDKASAYGSSNSWKLNGRDWTLVQETAKLPFIALQVITNDTTVNSDYAVVVPAAYTIVALADNKPDKSVAKNTFVNEHNNIFNQIRDNHLYETVGVKGSYDAINTSAYTWYNGPGAIPSPATHKVAYNDTIDLLPFIETHYSYTTYTRYGQSTVDKIMTPDLMAKLGLHYEFKEIHYTVGKNATSESAHIEHIGDAKSGKFAPRSVNADGTTIKGKQATLEVVDREPLVRVDLVTKDGKIVRYGYIKLRITETTESLDDVDVEIELPDYYMNCGDQMRLTWSQVENLILAKLNNKKGLKKQDFEEQYYFMAENNYTSMPVNNNGALYEKANENSFWATRWYRNSKGDIVKAADASTEAAAVNTFDYKKWTEDNNWFGRVWYTPHDNATDAHAWDEQTNVLIWDLHGYLEETEASTKEKKDYYRGNMKDLYQGVNLFKTLIDVAGVSYESKGLNTKAISTIIRFKHKTNGTYVNVKLTIPVGKLHFEYGSVDNKDWAHWYKFNAADPGVIDNKAPYWKEFDAHINPFKPSNNAYKFLDVTSYNQLLTDNWLDPTTMVVLQGKKYDDEGKEVANSEKTTFSKFYGVNAPVVSFLFTTPKKDVNSKEVSADATTGEWEVEGASGTIWTLKLAAHNGVDNTAIVAVKKNRQPYKYAPEEICYLDDQLTKEIDGEVIVVAQNNRIHYHGLEGDAALYPAATDLVNKAGAYDHRGKARFTLGKAGDLNEMKTGEYLDDNVGKTFTAYLKLDVHHGTCYDPLIGKNLFNIRVHRPINVVGKEYEWDDRVLNDNKLAIRNLVEIVDWNRFPVVGYKAAAVAQQNSMFNIAQPAFVDVYQNETTMKKQNKGIPYEYYGISELAVRYDEIRTDHAEQPNIRNQKFYDQKDIIANTKLVKDLNSLISLRENGKYRTLSVINADGTVVDWNVEHTYNHSNLNANGEGMRFGWIYYNNNASNVQLFHIYVPIAVKYNWGNIAYDYLLDPEGAKLDKDYTQTVWAIITVKGTH